MNRTNLTLYQLTLFGVLGALTFALKFAMAGLPNIEPVSLMVMLFAVTFGKKAVFPIGVYILLEFVVYGPGIWNIFYLYVWFTLAGAAWLLRGMEHPLGWAILSGGFGLLFGALCAPIDLILGGPAYALSRWISGIPYDILHCVGNFTIALLLFQPLRRLLARLMER